MKLFLFILGSFILLVQTRVPGKDEKIANTRANETKTPATKIIFEIDVLPVLVNNCSPCHFSGGKMYERIPFDKEATLLNNADKILKRIGKDEKKSIIRDFILQSREGK